MSNGAGVTGLQRDATTSQANLELRPQFSHSPDPDPQGRDTADQFLSATTQRQAPGEKSQVQEAACGSVLVNVRKGQRVGKTGPGDQAGKGTDVWDRKDLRVDRALKLDSGDANRTF